MKGVLKTMPSPTYLLSFRDTPVWSKYRDDPNGMPGADKVRYYLGQKGIVFIESQGDGVTVKANGDVIVTCQNDPTLVWPMYDDKDSPVTQQQDKDLMVLANLKAKYLANPASITQADKDLALLSLTNLALKLFGK